MKLLNDMTTEEICALSEDQLDLRVKLECANQGIPMMPEPPTIESFDIPRTVTAYKVRGTEFYFKTMDAANEVAKLLEKHQADLYKESYDYRTGYDVKWLDKLEVELGVDTAIFYDHNIIQEREQFLIKRKTIKDQYEGVKKEYTESRAKYRKIADSIYGEYYDAKRFKEQVAQAKKTFTEYLELAGGDKKKARQFFDKAFKEKLDEKIYSEIFPAIDEMIAYEEHEAND